MASSIQYYNVTIANNNTGLSSPQNGFIDWNTPEYYFGQSNTSLATTPASYSLALAQAKWRANRRWRWIIMQIGMMANVYVRSESMINTGGSAIAEPTSLFCQMVAEHGDSSLVTADESNPGQYLSGAAALQRCIARAMTMNYTLNADVWNPTSSTSYGSVGGTANVVRGGNSTSSLQVGAYAASLAAATAMITVTLRNF